MLQTACGEGRRFLGATLRMTLVSRYGDMKTPRCRQYHTQATQHCCFTPTPSGLVSRIISLSPTTSRLRRKTRHQRPAQMICRHQQKRVEPRGPPPVITPSLLPDFFLCLLLPILFQRPIDDPSEIPKTQHQVDDGGKRKWEPTQRKRLGTEASP